MYAVGAEVLGCKQREHRDWFDENDAALTKLLETKNKLDVEFLNATDARRTAAVKSFQGSKSITPVLDSADEEQLAVRNIN